MKKTVYFFLFLTTFLLLQGFVPNFSAYAQSLNLIQNANLSTIDTSSNLPQNWNQAGWGTNTATYSFLPESGSSPAKLNATIKYYSNGDAKWMFTPVAVQPNMQYSYTDSYTSTIVSEIDAAITDTSGNTTYQYLGTQSPNSTGANAAYLFTTAANSSTVSILHIIYSVGSMSTWNFSLVQAQSQTKSTIALLNPQNNGGISGTIQIQVATTGSIASVQYVLDNSNFAAPQVNVPYALSFDTTQYKNGNHTLSAVASDTANNKITAPLIQFTISNIKNGNLIPNNSLETGSNLPNDWTSGGWGNNTASYTYLNSGQSGMKSIETKITSYSDGDAKWYFTPQSVNPNTTYLFSDYFQSNIQSSLVLQEELSDGSIQYVYLLSLNQSQDWTRASVSFITPLNIKRVTVFHLIQDVGFLITDSFSLTQAITTPSVSITNPGNNQMLSGNSMFQATATANPINVQFLIDNKIVGVPVTQSPYGINWDSTQVDNGTHILTAQATYSEDKIVKSKPITLTISNTNPKSGNYIANSSLELAASLTLPYDWSVESWGVNNPQYSYTSKAHTGSHAVRIDMKSYTYGDAKWIFNPITSLTPNGSYKFTDYYESNVDTYVVAQFDLTDGTTIYQTLGTASPNPTYNAFSAEFNVPTNIKDVTVFHVIQNIGYLVTDDYTLVSYAPVPLARGLVSITMDDGWSSQYANALPILQKYMMPSTAYIISGMAGNSGYMTLAKMKALQNQGSEIASHTVSHPDLTTLSASQLTLELLQSQQTLQNNFAASINDFASPYGAYNSKVITEIKKYYASHRSTDTGYNNLVGTEK